MGQRWRGPEVLGQDYQQVLVQCGSHFHPCNFLFTRATNITSKPTTQ